MIDLSKKLVLLDRDGVLNEDRVSYVRHPSHLQVLPCAMRAIARLHRAHIRIGICTNQSGIARGYYDTAMLARIHEKLLQQVQSYGGRIDNILFCTSCDDNDPRRKPHPGMLLEQATHFSVTLHGVPFVGDNITDIQAAQYAGALPVLVRTGKGEHILTHYREQLKDVLIYQNLEEAVQSWLS